MTKIEYCDHTWNPVTGCGSVKISAGCNNCYAEAIVKGRLSNMPSLHYSQFRFNPAIKGWELDNPNRYVPKKGVVFIGDMCDLLGLREVYDEATYLYHFDKRLDAGGKDFAKKIAQSDADEVVNKVLAFVRTRPQQQFLILTKRHESLQHYDLAIHNLWVGVTICSQDEAYKIDSLVNSSAINKWLSIEPMLTPIGFNRSQLGQVDWVVCGGERTQKAKARPMTLDWAVDLMAACHVAGTYFFFKQLGSVFESTYPINAPQYKEVLRCKELPPSLELKGGEGLNANKLERYEV